jgi:pimeloyl-ACP methyl ester carboxylesterase
MADKKNLILVNPFYANSVMLGGLLDFIRDYFDVHFIDLPGFASHVPPLEHISFATFSSYVKDKIAEFDLDSYILGGISFGFFIASRMPIDQKCRGITAIFPYADSNSLQMKFKKKMIYNIGTRIIDGLGIGSWLWKKPSFKKFARWYSIYPEDRVDVILDELDGRTFFRTGRLILQNNESCRFHDLPTALVLSNVDTTVNSTHVLDLFRKNVEELLVLYTEIDHYPPQTDKEYFIEHFKQENIERLLSFFSDNK